MLDKIGQAKYSRLLVILALLIICIVSSLTDWWAGLYTAVFLVLAYLLFALVSGVTSLVSIMVTKPLRSEIREAIGVCTFLFVLAVLGIIVDANPFIRQYINDALPLGAQLNLSFVDPIFAGVCIAGVVAYTWLRIKSKAE
ncbi:hypothetical protein SAMN05444141_109272 [Pseudovibrio denitrificans]|uniref:Uncharacterized protein n=1 Tax=Pseudovibrio denitrificans TaxID=258256 RepID=A0A1I7DPG6_9HYPH|nr:hypothetical protein [Pseudovibrio denitrificans]SFU13525.1 hypothetical protein SAMN05444141_109272 [Pseudovibrio denitrificans]